MSGILILSPKERLQKLVTELNAQGDFTFGLTEKDNKFAVTDHQSTTRATAFEPPEVLSQIIEEMIRFFGETP